MEVAGVDSPGTRTCRTAITRGSRAEHTGEHRDQARAHKLGHTGAPEVLGQRTLRQHTHVSRYRCTTEQRWAKVQLHTGLSNMHYEEMTL